MEMTFEDNISNSYNLFRAIDKPDYTKSKLNLYADFVEILCLFSNTDGVTEADVYDRFFGTKDYSQEEGKAAEQRDKDEVFVNEIFIFIEERVILFGDDYPFQFNGSEVITLKSSPAFKNKVYLGLLLSSKLNIFKNFSSDLTSEFETISSYVLQNFLPINSIVKEFGKNSFYTGNAIKKITDLSKDLGLEIDEYEISCIDERNNQERGLDIIAWIPFVDNCQNKLIYLAQCACGKNTESKYHDTRRFIEYFKFYKTKPQHIMFVPYSLININKNKFYHSDLIEKEFLIFERKRIINLFKEEEVFITLEMNKIVNSCIEYKEDVV